MRPAVYFPAQIRSQISPYNSQELMETIKHSLPRRQYSHVTQAKRVKLLQLVLRKSHSISGAARHLSIALSTAKQIVKKYKATGTYFVANEERKQMSFSIWPQEIRRPSQSPFFLTEPQNINQNIQNPPIFENSSTQVGYFYVFYENAGWCFTGQAYLFQRDSIWN